MKKTNLVIHKSNQIMIFSLLFLSFIVSNIKLTQSLANLVEETDFYKIYSGNYFNLIIPKNTGPEMNFEVEDWGKIKFKFNYLSEYNSPTIYLNSLNYLSGKGYSFDHLEWDMYGLSETERTYVNLTRDNLDRNTLIEFSVMVFNTNVTIEDFSITALQTTYIEMRLSNWTYSPDTNGFALNVMSYMVDENEYLRIGPYSLIEEQQFAAEIWYEQYKFEFKFPKVLTIITNTDEEEQVFINSFETYNPAMEDNEPADFWISVPKRSDMKEMTLRFVCNFHTIVTQSSAFLSSSLAFVIIILIIIPIKIYRKKRSQYNA